VRNPFRTRRVAVVGSVAVITLAGAGAAFAFFTSSGTGTGSASVGSASNWTVSSPTNVSNNLLPGSGSEDLSFTVTNPGNGAQAFNSVTAKIVDDGSGNIVTSGGNVVGCLSSWFTATAGTPTPGYGTSIGHNGTATVPVTVTMQDSGTVQDACQGTAPEVQLTVNAG